MKALAAGQQSLDRVRIVVEVLAVALVAMVVLLFFWLSLFDEKPPVTTALVETLNANGRPQSVFRQGEVMLVHRDLCFTRDAPVQYGRRLTGLDTPRINVFINSEITMLRRGCIDNENAIVIPPHTPPGHYKFSVVMSFSNNAFQSGATLFPEPIIEVVK